MRTSTVARARARSSTARVGEVLLASALAGVLAVPVVAVVHDLLPSHPPAAVSLLVAAGALVAAFAAVALPVARSLAVGPGLRRAAAVSVGAGVGAVPFALPLLALLRAPTDPVAQLAWTLGEEDNAQIIGVAREVIMQGPAGGGLAEQYGTGAVVLATTVMRMLGRPDPALDPRLLAIHAFTLSTLLAVVVLASAVALVVLASLPASARARTAGAVLLGGATAGATLAALGVGVGLPMRTGFLTFTWAIAWGAMATAAVPLLVRQRLPARAQAGIAVHVVASTLLLISAWPFLIAVVLPGIVLLASALPLRRWWTGARRRPALSAAVVLALITATLAVVRGSAVGEVLSYGRDALTVDGSRIYFDDGLRTAILVAGAALVLLLARRADRRVLLAVVGPGLAGLASWGALHVAARLLTGGELNYAGTKLLYGTVAVASATVLPVLLTGWAGRPPRRAAVPLMAAAAAGALLWSSPTARSVEGWADRLAPSQPPHALAMVEAVERTTPELPVRCRPSPGTPVTDTSRWAVYFCVRWVEDALNEDRQSAFRDRYLFAPEGTFDPIVDEATATGLYGFAAVIPAGPGWFGWDGRS